MSDTGGVDQGGSADFYAQLSEEEQQCFDEPGLLKRVRGKEHRAAKLVHGFIDNFTTYFADLGSAIQAGDHAKVQLHSHSIKGAAANLGADKVSDVAAGIEQLAKNQQELNQLDDVLDQLQSEFAKYKSLARRRFGF